MPGEAPPSTDATRSRWPGRLAEMVALAAIVVATVVVRTRVADIPLERDEGEYAYVAQRMLAGTPPYAESNTLKWPGIFVVYAGVLAVGGESTRAIHLALAVANAATILLLYLLVRRWRGPLAAVLTAAVFAVLSLSLEMQGTVAQPEHFVVLLVVAALWVLDRVEHRQSGLVAMAFAGALLGLAIAFKQHAATFVVLGLVAVWSQCRDPNGEPRRGRRRLFVRVLALLAGVEAPLMAMALALAGLGVFDSFWEWTVRYARAYTSLAGPAVGWQQFQLNAPPIFLGATAVWLLAAIGLAAQFIDRSLRPRRAVKIAWLLTAAAAVSPGLLFRNHYFLYLAPIASVLAVDGALFVGRALAGLTNPRMAGAVLVVVAVVWTAWQQRLTVWFNGDAMQLTRAMYTTNPFPEALAIAEYLREHSHAVDQVAVLGSEPEIYFYSGRRSATPYLYMYPLMEPHENSAEMQWDMIAQIEAVRPRFLVYVHHPLSWLEYLTSENLVKPWFEDYRASYDRIALSERDELSDPIYYFGDAARRARADQAYCLEVLERRDAR